MIESLSPRRAALFVAVITCVAFINSFVGKFVFDDIHEIQKNPSLQTLPLLEAMFAGNRVPARPLPYLTFAIDHAIWGINPFGYHITNLAIHVLAALTVFDLVRLTLRSPRLAIRWGSRSIPLAMVIAMIWAVHPLQTQAVTYIYQRIESLTGMLCLLSLWAFARAAGSGWPRGLLAGSVAAAAAAMASKESAVVLPFLILAYHWFFVEAEPGESWTDSVWRRRWVYGALAACWILIGLQVGTQAAKYQEFEEATHTPLRYALTQPGVILWYLWLAIWPLGQRIDYSDWPAVESVRKALPALAIVFAALLITAAGTLRRKPWAFLGVAFFLLLAPTSSVMPIEALANEHRMYLALAAVVAGVVLALVLLSDWMATGRHRWVPRQPWAATAFAAATILLLVLATQVRNQLYSRVGGIWFDVLSKAPDNFRANWMMASILDSAGETEAAIELAERSIRSRPTTQVFSDLAAFHSQQGDNATAERILRRGLELQRQRLGPEHKAVLATVGDLAVALRGRGKLAEADLLCRESVEAMRRQLGEADPATISAMLIMGSAAGNRGDFPEAERLAQDGLDLARKHSVAPDAVVVNATTVLADILRRAGRPREAAFLCQTLSGELARSGNRSQLDLSPLEETLAASLADMGRLDEVVSLRRRQMQDYRRRLGDDHPQSRVANARLAEAIAAERTAAGDHAAAATLYRQLLPAYSASLGSDHPETIAIKSKLEASETATTTAPDPAAKP
jgi:protein O-mannosyl-transferase